MKLRLRFEQLRGRVVARFKSLAQMRYRIGAVGLGKIDLKGALSMDVKELPQLLARLWHRSGSINTSGDRIGIRDYARWPRLYRRMSLALAFLVTFAMTASVLWSDPVRRLEALSGETVLLKERYVQLSTGAALKMPYEQRIAEVEAQFGEVLEKIPASLEAVQVLRQVSEAARGSGLHLQWFKPSSEMQADAYAVLPVDIRLSGSYHAVGRFMEAISRMKHLITVDVMLETMGAGSGELALATKLKAYRGDAVRLNPQVLTGQGSQDAQP